MLCNAESFRVSRMRETRPSGLMRAEAAAMLPLRYSTVLLRPIFTVPLLDQPRIEPIGVVEHVAAIGIIDHQFQLFGAGDIDGNGQRRVAAADDRTGKLLLAVDQDAKLHTAAAAGRVVNADISLETCWSTPALTPCPSPKGRGEIDRPAGRRRVRRDP